MPLYIHRVVWAFVAAMVPLLWFAIKGSLSYKEDWQRLGSLLLITMGASVVMTVLMAAAYSSRPFWR